MRETEEVQRKANPRYGRSRERAKAHYASAHSRSKR